MKREDVKPQSYLRYLICDRCGREAEVYDTDCEFQEFTSVEQRAGYSSIFGDGNKVEIDLCQHCLKETLEPWLRIKEPKERYWGFDPAKHGGEFPIVAGGDPMEPVGLEVDHDLSTGLLVGSAPGIPDAHTQGETIEEVKANLAEVINLLQSEGSNKPST